MTPDQKLRASEFIQMLELDVTPKERRGHNGFTVLDRHGQFGFVRFNVAGPNSGKFTVYVLVAEFDDRRHRFVPQRSGKLPHFKFIFSPDSEEDVNYALGVVRSAYRS